MKLSPGQIITLKKLISYKGYPEIDLQYEILDHVACKVEVLLEENPTMELDDAFRKVHSEFGIFGFSDLAESYTKSIEKRYRRLFWQEVKLLFGSYRISYPAAITFILFWLSVHTRPFGYELSLPIWAVLFFFAGAIFIGITYTRIDKNLKNYIVFKSTSNWMLTLNLFTQVNFYALQYLENPDYSFEFTMQGAVKALGLAFIIMSFFSMFLLPRILSKAIEETKKLQAVYER